MLKLYAQKNNFFDKDSIFSNQEILQEEADVIAEFKEEPYFLALQKEKGTLHKTNAAFYTSRFSTFVNIDYANNKIYIVSYPSISNFQHDTILTNTTADFLHQNIKFIYPPNAKERKVVFRGLVNILPSNEWNSELYVKKNDDQNTLLRFYNGKAIVSVQPDVQYQYFSTEPFRTVGNNIGAFSTDQPTPNIHLFSANDTIVFGTAPIYAKIFYGNEGGQNPRIRFSTNFYGSLNEEREMDIFSSSWKAYDKQNNILVEERLFAGNGADVPLGNYKVELINTNYFIGGIKGKATMHNFFDLRSTDKNSPQITSLKILNMNGKLTEKFSKNEDGNIIFSCADFSAGDILLFKGLYQPVISNATHLYSRVYKSNEAWKEIPITEIVEDTMIGYLYKANLSNETQYDSTGIDIKIHMEDASGNATDWILEPAFYVNGIPKSLEGPLPFIPKQFALHQNYPNPFNPQTQISVDVPEKTKLTVKIYDVIGKEIQTLYNKEIEGGTYHFMWDGKNYQGNIVASGIYFYKMETPQFVQTKKMVLLK